MSILNFNMILVENYAWNFNMICQNKVQQKVYSNIIVISGAHNLRIRSVNL